MNSTVAEKNFISSRLGIPYENLSQSYLRAETALGNQSAIQFVLQQGQKPTASQLITERLINLNDEFVITQIFIGLKQIAADSPTNLQQLNARVYTWENPEVFSGTNAVNVSTIYNGSLSFTVDRKVFIPQFPVRAFRRVPRTQENTLWVYTGAGVAATDIRGFDSFDNGLYGFYPTEPTKIDGRQTLDVTIDLGAQAVNYDDASNQIYAVMECRGYLVVNAKS